MEGHFLTGKVSIISLNSKQTIGLFKSIIIISFVNSEIHDKVFCSQNVIAQVIGQV